MNYIYNFLDGFNYALAAILWVYTILKYSNLPKIIPIHFGLDGKPDNFGNKVWFFLLPIVATGIFILIYSTDKDFKNVNFPFALTAENRDTQIFIFQLLSKLLLLLILLLFLDLQKGIVKFSLSSSPDFKINPLKYISAIFILIALAVLSAYIYK
ncbi:DUF1648 domain-containing protein [Halpernia sp.]|uniref:DUF1648 domain-containing protein n=1 Tax=Halpernia sp. TaxID=2782209 RepID=UPI003A8FA5CA